MCGYMYCTRERKFWRMAYRFLLKKAGWSISRRCLLPGSQCTWTKAVPLIVRTASGIHNSNDVGDLEISGIRVEKIDRCVMIRMERGENRLNKEFVQAMNQALDVVESYKDAIAVVTTGKQKFYSNGLDLEELESMTDSEKVNSFNEFQKLLARLLTFPMLTVAAINGHVYAAGAIFAMVQDYRVMRTERGWYCLPEVFIKRKFSPGLLEVLKARLPQPTLHRAVVLGQRYTADDAIEAKLVDEVCPLPDLEERALQAAYDLAGKEPGLDRKILAVIKHGLYRDAYTTLNESVGQVYTDEFMLKSDY